MPGNPAERTKRPNKYHAKRTTVGPLTFDSKREARRWLELCLLEKAGTITTLQRQVRFGLHAVDARGDMVPVGDYIADFVYDEWSWTPGKTRHRVVEDCKGVRTALYRWKKKHFEIQYGYVIRET